MLVPVQLPLPCQGPTQPPPHLSPPQPPQLQRLRTPQQRYRPARAPPTSITFAPPMMPLPNDLPQLLCQLVVLVKLNSSARLEPPPVRAHPLQRSRSPPLELPRRLSLWPPPTLAPPLLGTHAHAPPRRNAALPRLRRTAGRPPEPTLYSVSCPMVRASHVSPHMSRRRELATCTGLAPSRGTAP